MNSTNSRKLRGILSLVLLIVRTEASVPSVELNPAIERIEITSAAVGAAHVLAEGVFQTTDVCGVGRTRQIVEASRLAMFPPIPPVTNAMVLYSKQSGFDLWQAVETIGCKPGSDIVFEFNILAKEKRSIVLGFGCSGNALIEVNRKSVFATVTANSPAKGNDEEFIRTQNLITLSLNLGINNVRILCRKVDSWKAVPEPHELNQWMLSAELYQDSNVAWKEHRERNFDLLDTPIVPAFTDLRCVTFEPGRVGVLLSDINGNNQGVGNFLPNGSIDWQTPLPPVPFIGFISVGTDATDGIIVTGPSSIEKVATDVMTRKSPDTESSAWRFRSEHLLTPQFRLLRDNWWARKLVLSVMMVVCDRKSQTLQQLFEGYRSASIGFRHYRSKIDGSEQYYLYHEARKRFYGVAPILAILPPVDAEIHSFLEGPVVANLRDLEDLASLSDELGIDVLWPGYVEIDYGGNFSRKILDECLMDVANQRRSGLASIYLLGTCSSAVSAIGYAETRNVSGVILQSPDVSRRRHRWMNGLTVDTIQLPTAVLVREQTNNKIDRLIGTPVYMVYNNVMMGHGNQSETAALVDFLKVSNADVQAFWPRSEHFYLWGERLRVQEEPMFRWINIRNGPDANGAQTRRGVLKKEAGSPITIKDAMLQGFKISEIDDPLIQAWLKDWIALWVSYRGSVGQYKDSSRPTTVVARVLDELDVNKMTASTFFCGTELPLSGRHEIEAISSNDRLFGFRLSTTAHDVSVEILRTPKLDVAPPHFDIVVDGCAKGMLWKYIDTHWVLVDLWL